MKTLYESLLDDFDTLSEPMTPKSIKLEIKQFLKENYRNHTKMRISKNPNKDGLYEVSCKAGVIEFMNGRSQTLTNGMFIFTVCEGDFNCQYCKALTSLKGAPKYVQGNFDCYLCSSLTSLEGAPEEVGGEFSCKGCDSLISLKGSPKKVGKSFVCSCCYSLTSLEGAPEEVGESFDCYGCKNLISLKGAPKKIDSIFMCYNCYSLTSLKGAPEEVRGTFYCDDRFTEDDVRKYCKNVGNIYIPLKI